MPLSASQGSSLSREHGQKLVPNTCMPSPAKRASRTVKISGRVRNYPRGFHERQAARVRLPAWAKLAQLLILFVFWLIMGLIWFGSFDAIYHMLHPQFPAARMTSSSAGIIALSALFGTLPLALIAVNLALWIIPPSRRANEAAAQGLPGMTF